MLRAASREILTRPTTGRLQLLWTSSKRDSDRFTSNLRPSVHARFKLLRENFSGTVDGTAETNTCAPMQVLAKLSQLFSVELKGGRLRSGHRCFELNAAVILQLSLVTVSYESWTQLSEGRSRLICVELRRVCWFYHRKCFTLE